MVITMVTQKFERDPKDRMPTIEQLVELNKYLNRRLKFVEVRAKYFLVDGEDKEIKADPFGIPNLVLARQNTYNPALPWTNERPYRFSTVMPYTWQEWLTRREVYLTLGKDCHFEATPEEISAMFEAATGGPGLANAYVLGWRVHGIHETPGTTVVPVQYYRINLERHKKLSVESDQDYLRFLTNLVKEERDRMESAPRLS